ncbi:MAG: tetratricopeptide repeat protein [Cytophagales bacterium]|nr:tetratricopeptide repeat protein [Cytophagales bacterium]
MLKTDPSYHYALKGVAWIAFSHDKNTPEAKRIYTHLLNQTHAPDLHLNLAEIAEFEGNLTEKKRNTDAFLQGVSQPKYGEMYNKYLVHQYIEAKNSEAALQIAQRETENRPTPETFDLLAWVYLQQGNPARALSVAETEIANRTFEPEALYHLGMIYQANNQTQKAEKYLEEALESEYELGPVVAKAIRQALQRL